MTGTHIYIYIHINIRISRGPPLRFGLNLDITQTPFPRVNTFPSDGKVSPEDFTYSLKWQRTLRVILPIRVKPGTLREILPFFRVKCEGTPKYFHAFDTHRLRGTFFLFVFAVEVVRTISVTVSPPVEIYSSCI